MAIKKALSCLTSLFLIGTSIVLSASIQTAPQPLIRKGENLEPPFEARERLVFEVNWKPLVLIPAFKAGELDLSIRESHYRGKPTYTISALATSNGLLSSIANIEVEDYFESIIDRQTFQSYRFYREVRQGRRKRDQEVLIDYENSRIHFMETDLGTGTPRTLRDQTLTAPAALFVDILSVFYAARLRRLQPQDQFLVQLVSESRLTDVLVTAKEREEIRTPLGKFPALKLITNTRVFTGGGDFRIWYSQDYLRFPVRFEADVKFGKVFGQIIQVETAGTSRGLIRTR